MLAWYSIPGMVASKAVLEIEQNVKHQQLVSGVSVEIYHLAHYVFDVVNFFILLCVAMVLMLAFKLESLTNATFALTSLCFACATVAYAYVFSFLFTKHTSAQIFMKYFTLFTGLLLPLLSFVLDSISESTCNANDSLKYVWRIFPAFCFFDTAFLLSLIGNDKKILHRTACKVSAITRSSMETSGWNMTFMLISSFVCLLLVFLLENNVLTWSSSSVPFEGYRDNEEDDDVR